MIGLEKISKNVNLMSNTSWAAVAVGMIVPEYAMGVCVGIWAGSAVSSIKYVADSMKQNPIIGYQERRK